jgi:integral membrane sensor domain MASE1
VGRVGGRYLVQVAGLAVAYYVTGKLGLDLAFATDSVTAIWPPTGIAIAALVLAGPSLWPGVALGAFLTNVDTGVPIGTVLGITAGNTLAATAGALMLRRHSGFRPTLERPRDVLALALLGGAAAMAVSATVGVASLLAGNEIAGGDAASTWRTWWLGDVGGVLIVAPALLVAATNRRRTDRPPGHLVEGLVLVAALVGLSVLVFTVETPLIYLLFPLVVWAAMRFWQPGAAAAGLATAAAAVYFTSNGEGPFAAAGLDERLLLAETFCGVAGITALILAAVTRERARAERDARRMAMTLQDSLLAPDLPRLPRVETAAYYRAAGRDERVGGDFYDLFQAEDGSWALVVGDVCGKGTRAATLTALARYTLRAVAAREQTPGGVLRLLNEAIIWQRGGESLASVAYARLEPGSPPVRVQTASAGHPLPIVIRANGSVEQVGRPGTMLGVKSIPELCDADAELGLGDVFVMYTDGLTDAFAPRKIVTMPELLEVLSGCAGCAPMEVIDTIEERLLAGSRSTPRDDVAIVAVRLAPTAAEPGEPVRLKAEPGRLVGATEGSRG